ncbi:hypothetical protein M426DRAFT_103827 [Hypoxylon sp. CI-4A]|nr:hypothetical protein M426DRAFT_103827 [Hypoxylon sp. CI-4A]
MIYRGYMHGGIHQWSKVRVIHVASLSNNWIASSIVKESRLQLENTRLEYITLDGKEFKSKQCTEITYTVDRAERTMMAKFCITAEETVPFEMLVTTAAWEELNHSVTRNGLHIGTTRGFGSGGSLV